AMGWTRRIPEDADGIVCVGEDEYLRYRERHPHVLHLPNGVDTAIFMNANSQHATRNSQIPACPSPDFYIYVFLCLFTVK
ncbi:MAG: hypothetical protein IIZ66_03565, partial [Clostridia bacterium]|nr:hypothetical protein [Clostridia bacterium]